MTAREPDRRQKILIAEDSRVIRAMVTAQLVSRHYLVVEAENGLEALDRCREESPDVILLDVEMPELDGYQTLRRLKDDPALADIPVVFLTARDQTSDVIQALQMGAHDYLRKPFDLGELLARVSAAIRVKTLQDQLLERNAELSVSSRVDFLTEIYNRRQLEWEMQRLVSSVQRFHSHVGAIMVDVDHFKVVNDTRGHAVGDMVLKNIASTIRAELRIEDVLGRWGGEEFLVLVDNCTSPAAGHIGERIRSAVARAVFGPADADPLRVTISVGWSLADESNTATLLTRADAALYRAKAAGRNRVVADADSLVPKPQ